MPRTRDPAALEFSRRLSVETPEHVTLRLELAGLGSRAAAAIYDALAVFAIVAVVVLLSSVVVGAGLAAAESASAAGWAGAALVLLIFVVVWGYFALFEAFAEGRTPGKRRVGIRVVMDTGHPITFQAAMIRNLLRLVDVQPGVSYVVGLIVAAIHSQNKRLGDIVAGTIVVRDRADDMALAAPEILETQQIDAGPAQLSDDEFRLLDQFMGRYVDLEADVRERFATELTNRLGQRFPDRDPRPATFLMWLHRDEQTRRRAKAALRRTAGGTKATGSADRFVVLRHAAWERFRQRAGAAERTGLKRLSGEELTAFAADYRLVAADLARARTYGVDPRVLAYVERIVSSGHNALYGLRGVRRLRLRRLLLAALPGAAYRARRYVLVACLLFLLPGVAGYVLVRERPEIAVEIMPVGMVARAEAGEYEQVAGRGYAEAPEPYLPLVASSIITNNVQVAFGAFAFGITAGIGTVVLLFFNGLFFGAVLGLFANYDLAGWILTFVAGHGVLELTAIFMAGGAGLLVARALVAPGDLTRRDALVVEGRAAIRVLGAAVCFLILAGIIEGFLSASGDPPAFKLGVSAASAVLVALYFEAGRRATASEAT